MPTAGITQAYAGDIYKFDETPEGLMVLGVASSPRVDLDQQICDPDWLKSAMPAWYEFANVRAQHGPVAAGVGRELIEGDDDKWGVKSLIVDDDSIKKVKAKVYKGYSIGIRNAKVVKDKGASGGRIVGGDIVEISLVDRPCNPDAILDPSNSLALAKAEGAHLAPVDMAGVVIAKFDEPITADVTKTAVAEDVAAPANVEPPVVEPATVVEPAVPPAVVSAADPKAVAPIVPKVRSGRILTPRSHKSAVALVDRVLAGEITKAATNDESDDIAGALAVIGQIADLIISEATELKTGRLEELNDISTLLRAAQSMQWFLCAEKNQHGQPSMDGEITYIDMAADNDIDKALSDAQKTKFSTMLKDDPVKDITAAIRRLSQWAASGNFPTGTTYDDLKWMYGQYVAELKRRDPDSKAGGNFPAQGSGKDAVADLQKCHSLLVTLAAVKADAMPAKKGKKAKASKAVEPNETPAVDAVADDAASVETAPDTTLDTKTVGAPILDVDEIVSKAVAKANAASEERYKALEAELAKVKATPIPGAPFIIPPPAPTPAAAEKSVAVSEKARLLAEARATNDPTVAAAYRLAANEIVT